MKIFPPRDFNLEVFFFKLDPFGPTPVQIRVNLYTLLRTVSLATSLISIHGILALNHSLLTELAVSS